MGIEPTIKHRKALKYQRFLKGISILVSDFEKSSDLVFCFEPVSAGQVGVNLSHCLIVGPAAEPHCFQLTKAQVIGEGGERVTEAMGADFGNTGVSASLVDLV